MQTTNSNTQIQIRQYDVYSEYLLCVHTDRQTQLHRNKKFAIP